MMPFLYTGAYAQWRIYIYVGDGIDVGCLSLPPILWHSSIQTYVNEEAFSFYGAK